MTPDHKTSEENRKICINRIWHFFIMSDRALGAFLSSCTIQEQCFNLHDNHKKKTKWNTHNGNERETKNRLYSMSCSVSFCLQCIEYNVNHFTSWQISKWLFRIRVDQLIGWCVFIYDYVFDLILFRFFLLAVSKIIQVQTLHKSRSCGRFTCIQRVWYLCAKRNPNQNWTGFIFHGIESTKSQQCNRCEMTTTITIYTFFFVFLLEYGYNFVSTLKKISCKCAR